VQHVPVHVIRSRRPIRRSIRGCIFSPQATRSNTNFPSPCL